ncbi:RHS repeat protein [Paenibacillus lemnae]|uniref:RHS repeat protein n=1 Tax=Paenibacillus lemnae TaxID=1330551 RepID=A0A848MAA0_PAELE|nr:RHS repeat protein [Paenibacillus lemnae]NMO96843.1 RHS repeat protein [Paenibacillus lemnae]
MQQRKHLKVLATLVLAVTSTASLPYEVSAKTESNLLAATLPAPSVSEAKRPAKEELPQIEKEEISKRTLNSKRYLLSDGSYKEVISLTPLHYQDKEGVYQDIVLDFEEKILPTVSDSVYKESTPPQEVTPQTSLDIPFEQQEVIYTSQTVPYSIDIHKSFQKGFTLGHNGSIVSFLPLNTIPAEVENSMLSKEKAGFKQVWTDTDVDVNLTPSGVVQSLHLKSDQAPSQFNFELKDSVELFESGALRLGQAWVQDASGQSRQAIHKVIQEEDSSILEISYDKNGLVYPVTLHSKVSWSSYSQESGDHSTSMQFDLSMLPKEVDILGTSLSFNVLDLSAVSELHVLRNIEPVALHSDAGSQLYEVDAEHAYGQQALSDTGLQTIKLEKDLVTGWLSGEFDNYGLKLQLNEQNEFISLSSADEADLSLRPMLQIYYTEGMPDVQSVMQAAMLFTYSYDEQNRLQFIDFPTGDRIRFTYDSSGNLIQREFLPVQ